MPLTKEKNRIRMQKWRRAHGIPERPKVPYEPGEYLGISRATYFRRERKLRRELTGEAFFDLLGVSERCTLTQLAIKRS